MTHPIVLEALADARRNDLLRAAARTRGVVPAGEQRRRRVRLASWLKAQLHHPTPAAGVVTIPRCAPVTR
jgi:hypothetical protein